MKIAKLVLAQIIAVAALFALAERSSAACGDPSGDLVTALNNAGGVLVAELFERTNNPAATLKEKREAAAIARALTALSKPATNSAQLYDAFLKGAQQLGTLALQDPEISTSGSNVFTAFIAQAQGDIGCTDARIAALGQFVRTKRAASNQLVQAVRTLTRIASESNPQVGLLLGKLVFQKIVVANKLAAIGEANPGFALDSVVGKTLTHTERGETGTVTFDTDTQATEVNSDGTNVSAYVYGRTALHNALLVLTNPEDAGGTNTTTVKLKYLSNTNGNFTYKFQDASGSRGSGSGRFTIE